MWLSGHGGGDRCHGTIRSIFAKVLRNLRRAREGAKGKKKFRGSFAKLSFLRRAKSRQDYYCPHEERQLRRPLALPRAVLLQRHDAQRVAAAPAQASSPCSRPWTARSAARLARRGTATRSPAAGSSARPRACRSRPIATRRPTAFAARSIARQTWVRFFSRQVTPSEALW